VCTPEDEHRFCPSCGAGVYPLADSCPFCGETLPADVSVIPVNPEEITLGRVFYSFGRAFRRAKRLAGWEREIAE
jgi:predicted amidophosphoribosyltransferase